MQSYIKNAFQQSQILIRIHETKAERSAGVAPEVNLREHVTCVTAAVSGTKYSGELAASDLMVTFTFMVAIG